MAAPFALRELQFNAEASFAVNAESPTSNTYATRILCEGVTWTPEGSRIPDPSYMSRMNDQPLSHIGPRSGTLEFTTNWCGHLLDSDDTLTETWLQDLLSDGLGGGNTAQEGGAISGTGSTATVVNVNTPNILSLAGGIIRVGSPGDGKGEGHAAVVASGNTLTPEALTLLTALPTAPTTAGHVVCPTMLAYHDESVAQTLATKRFLLAHTTTGAQIHVMGCQLAGLRFSISHGAIPKITWTYRAAYWARGAATTPSASPAVSANFAAPVAGGKLFINDVGTATSATIVPSEIDLQVDLGTEPIYGPGGAGSLQYVVGWARTGVRPMLSVTIPWVTTYETWFDVVNHNFVYKHILLSLGRTIGRAVGFYMPRVFPVGERPSMVTNSNNQQYVRVVFVGREGATEATELTRSAIRFFGG